MEEYTDEQVAQDIFATLDSIGIVERIRLIAESDRTDDEKDNLARNERHIQLKMKITKEQILRVNQVIASLPIAYLAQAQEIVKILNESAEEDKKPKTEKK